MCQGDYRKSKDGEAHSLGKPYRRKAGMTELTFTVPGLTPPSGNDYVRHTRGGRHYVTQEAEAFKQAVALFSRGKSVIAKRFGLEVWIYMGYGQRGDGDNFWKVLADGLVQAGVIHSDAAVDDWILHKRRDRTNARTEIRVYALGE